ncbi:hypothetical protein ACWGIV_26390 [Streptomyces sp. NPDC054844]
MSNRNFGEVVQGPMTPDGPTVDEIRAMRQGSGSFHHREGRTPLDSAVIQGESVPGDGAISEDQMAEIRKAAGIGRENHHQAQAAKAYSDRRDLTTGGVVRTWEDDRTELVDETRPASRWRGGAS